MPDEARGDAGPPGTAKGASGRPDSRGAAGAKALGAAAKGAVFAAISVARLKRAFKSVFSFQRLIGYALLAAFLTIHFAEPQPLQFLKLRSFDFYQQLKPREIPPPERQPVTIIDLDEASLAEVGQWPWPRDTVAKMVLKAAQMGASIIAFDVVFAEPDRMNPAAIADNLKAGLDDAAKEQLRKLKSNDQIFADIIKHPKIRVVLGQVATNIAAEGQAGPPVRKSVAVRKLKKTAPDPQNVLLKFPAMVRNVPVLEQAAASKVDGHGIFSVVPEIDGVVRRVPAMFVQGEHMFPALSIEMLRVATGRSTAVVRVNEFGIQDVALRKDIIIPTDRNGRIWPYYSNHDPTKYVPAKDILNGTADPKQVRGKMMIVGTSAIGLKDIRAIPTDPSIPGVEVHAQIIEAALNKSYLKRPGWVIVAEPLVILLGGLAMIILVPWLGAKWTFAVFAATAAGVSGGSWHLFAEQQVLIDAVYPLIAIFIMYSSLTYLKYVQEEADRKQVRSAFSHYLSPEMVSRLAEDPSSLKLGGEMRDMTLLFCDVRGFTTISEQFDPVGLTQLINKLLTPLTNVILERRGTVDKYMGDCIMAFWNAPLDNPGHALDGCRSALAMLAEMGPLNERLKAEAEEEGRKHIELRVGLGLNTGPCVVGNMGSDQRFDYSVLGDTVNLAARLEGQSKNYGMNVVIGPATQAAVGRTLATIELDLIRVKGKFEGVHIYGLLGDEEMFQDKTFRKMRELNGDMLRSYRDMDFLRARELIADLRQYQDAFGIGTFLDIYEDRINEYLQTPPPPDWDGVYVATSK